MTDFGLNPNPSLGTLLPDRRKQAVGPATEHLVGKIWKLNKCIPEIALIALR